MKKCHLCKETKPDGAFNRHLKAKDGLQSQCRECNNAFRIAWHRENPERTRAYDRKRANDPKVIARKEVSKAVKSGVLNRPSNCSACGIRCKVEGHHETYEDPLVVVWLCRLCHEREDATLRTRTGSC